VTNLAGFSTPGAAASSGGSVDGVDGERRFHELIYVFLTHLCVLSSFTCPAFLWRRHGGVDLSAASAGRLSVVLAHQRRALGGGGGGGSGDGERRRRDGGGGGAQRTADASASSAGTLSVSSAWRRRVIGGGVRWQCRR